MRPLLVALLGVGFGCATPSVGQGGARFDGAPAPAVQLPAEALYAVCWPQDSLAASAVTLSFLPGDVVFAVAEGASNSTGRCLREIATTYPWSKRPDGDVVVRPPKQPIDGWAALAWVELLSTTRYGPERGVRAPGPLVAQCLAKAGTLRPGGSFVVRHTPLFEVRAVPQVVADAERCVEAVLAATAWPSSRELFFAFDSRAGAPPAAGDVSAYVSPPLSTGAALDPALVRDVVRLAGPKVSACWEEALARRTAIGGGRTFRFRVDDAGAVTAAWVAGTMSDGPTAADYVLDGCLAGVLRSLRFPPLAGDGVYTWVFASRG